MLLPQHSFVLNAMAPDYCTIGGGGVRAEYNSAFQFLQFFFHFWFLFFQGRLFLLQLCFGEQQKSFFLFQLSSAFFPGSFFLFQAPKSLFRKWFFFFKKSFFEEELWFFLLGKSFSEQEKWLFGAKSPVFYHKTHILCQTTNSG